MSTDTAIVGEIQQLPTYSVERPRELANWLFQWVACLKACMAGDRPEGFDPQSWTVAAAAAEALISELERRGFVRIPATDPNIDPIRFFYEWGDYLERILPHVWDGDPLQVETALVSMMGKPQ